MKRRNLLSLLLAMVIVLSSLAPIFASGTITDMPEGWSKEYMEAAVDNGILKGNNGLVRPKDNITRAELVTILSRVLALEEKADLSNYKDADETKWYYDDLAKGVKAGIIEGRSSSIIDPTGLITREEAFTMLARVFLLSDSENMLDKYSDGKEVSKWAEPSMNAMVGSGYVEGDQNNKLTPKREITREEIAALVYRLVDLYVGEDLVGKEVKGNAVVNASVSKIKDTTIHGDLIIAEGANVDKIVLDNVKVLGRLVVRSKAEISLTNESYVNYAKATLPSLVSVDESSSLTEAGENIKLEKELEVISKEVVGEGERFDLDTGFKKAVWVEIEEDGKLVGQGGMTEADGIAKINLTKEGKYKLVVKDEKDGKVLKEVILNMLAKKVNELEESVKELEKLLAEIAKVDRTKYTEESFNNLSAKYSEGMTLIEKAKTDEKPSIEELKKAGEDFKKALEDLKELGEEEVENKEELKKKKGDLSVLIAKANEKISILGFEDSNKELIAKAEAQVNEALEVAHNSDKVSEVEESIVGLTSLIIELDKAIGK